MFHEFRRDPGISFLAQGGKPLRMMDEAERWGRALLEGAELEARAAAGALAVQARDFHRSRAAIEACPPPHHVYSHTCCYLSILHRRLSTLPRLCDRIVILVIARPLRCSNSIV